MELSDISVPKGTKEKNLVAVIKAIYPKYDKTIHSKCKHGDVYGVMLRPDAMRSVCIKLSITPEATPQSEPPRPRKADRRTLPCRISCRLSQSEYSELQQNIKADGFDTMQDWLTKCVRQYIKKKSAAAKKRGDTGIERSPS